MNVITIYIPYIYDIFPSLQTANSMIWMDLKQGSSPKPSTHSASSLNSTSANCSSCTEALNRLVIHLEILQKATTSCETICESLSLNICQETERMCYG